MANHSPTDTVDVQTEAGAVGAVTVNLSWTTDVEISAMSHQGKVRKKNEDNYLVARFERSMQTMSTNLPSGYVPLRAGETTYGMVVADGMGGHAAGEIASQQAIYKLIDLVLHTPDWIMRLDDEFIREVMRRMRERFRDVS